MSESLNMTSKIYNVIILCTILFICDVYSLKIKYCNSNMLHEVQSYKKGSKAIIRFNDTGKIVPGPGTIDLKIWCDTDSLIEKCRLEHNSQACESDIPIKCNSGFTCPGAYKNKISINRHSRRRCEFQFKSVDVSGKMDILLF